MGSVQVHQSNQGRGGNLEQGSQQRVMHSEIMVQGPGSRAQRLQRRHGVAAVRRRDQWSKRGPGRGARTCDTNPWARTPGGRRDLRDRRHHQAGQATPPSLSVQPPSPPPPRSSRSPISSRPASLSLAVRLSDHPVCPFSSLDQPSRPNSAIGIGNPPPDPSVPQRFTAEGPSPVSIPPPPMLPVHPLRLGSLL